MIETEQQRRWWFATHPEYSSHGSGARDRRSGDDDNKSGKVSPEAVDAYVDQALTHVDGPLATFLRAIKERFGTEGDERRLRPLLASNDESTVRSDEQPHSGQGESKDEEAGFWDAVVKGTDNTLEAWERLTGLGIRPRSNRERFLEDLTKKKGPRPPNHAGHHIVPEYDARFPEAERARKLLTDKFKIDLNSGENGVWLPYEKGMGPGRYHPGVHNGAYYRQLLQELRKAKTKEQAINTLQNIGRRLSEGKFP